MYIVAMPKKEVHMINTSPIKFILIIFHIRSHEVQHDYTAHVTGSVQST